MYQGVVFLDIEKLISKSNSKMNDSIKQKLLMMQQNDYLLVICSPFPLEKTARLMGKEFRCSFILFNGRLVILNEQPIVSLPIAKKVINEIREVCKHTNHSLAYYTRNLSLLDCSNELINRFQEVYPLEQFQQINRLDDEAPIYQLRIFNLEDRKDVLYETFFEQSLHCQRQDIYSLTAKNNRGTLSNAITTLLDEIVLMNREHIFYLGNQFMEAIEPMKDLSKIMD